MTVLTWDFAALKPVSETAAGNYQQAGCALTQSVDKEMTAHIELKNVLGGNPLQVMYTNHSNHALFLDLLR